MKIRETEDAWHVIFFEDAPVIKEEDRWMEKGWRLKIGEVDGRAVPKEIFYAKSRFSLDDAINYASKIKECPICTALNKDIAKIELEIDVPSDHITKRVSATQSTPSAPSAPPQSQTVSHPPHTAQTHSSFTTSSSLITKVILSEMFTRPALLMLGELTGDDELIDLALQGDMSSLMDELTAFLRGEIGIFRSERKGKEGEDREKERKEKKEKKEKKRGKEDEEFMSRATSLLSEVMKYA